MLDRAFKASMQFARSADFAQSAQACRLDVRGLPQTPEAANEAPAGLKRSFMNLLNHMLNQVERHTPERYDSLWKNWPAQTADDGMADYFYGHGFGALGEITQKAADNIKKPSVP